MSQCHPGINNIFQKNVFEKKSWNINFDFTYFFPRMSNKSDKNLGDFDDENSVDEEMLQLAQSLQQQQQLANMANFCHQQRITAPRVRKKTF